MLYLPCYVGIAIGGLCGYLGGGAHIYGAVVGYAGLGGAEVLYIVGVGAGGRGGCRGLVRQLKVLGTDKALLALVFYIKVFAGLVLAQHAHGFAFHMPELCRALGILYRGVPQVYCAVLGYRSPWCGVGGVTCLRKGMGKGQHCKQRHCQRRQPE